MSSTKRLAKVYNSKKKKKKKIVDELREKAIPLDPSHLIETNIL